jgi:uncharacterized membrane protein
VQKERLLAFSDGVIAIIITIMVLELKVPHGAAWSDLAKLLPVFSSYVLSFIYVAIYWNNHHHMMYTAHKINGAVLWANMHLLFWLSVIPFSTGWMGENRFAMLPVAVYGVTLLMPAIAYVILQTTIIKVSGPGSLLATALGTDLKGKISPVLYLAGIGLAFVRPWISCLLYAVVALLWLIPDRRIEKRIH